MKALLGVLAALGLSFVLNTNTAQARVYVSGGVSFHHGPISVGIYSGPRVGYYGYRRYYPYYYYPRYYRYYPQRYYKKHYYNRPYRHYRNHRHYRNW